MYDAFEERVLPALDFLQQRRFDLFNPQFDEQERDLFSYVASLREPLQQVADGLAVKAFLYFKDHAFWRTKHEQQRHREVLDRLRSEGVKEEELAFLRAMNGDSDNDLLNNALTLMRTYQFACQELLRHERLLPEQRAIQGTLEGRMVADHLPSWYSSPADELHLQNTRFTWASAWYATLHATETQPLDRREWNLWFTTVQNAALRSTEYRPVQNYLWELAKLAYSAPTDPQRKFLGGALYASFLARQNADHLVEKVSAELAELLPTILRPENHSYLRAGKTAWRVSSDEKPDFIFKSVSRQDARLLNSIHAIVQNPLASYWRMASFMVALEDPARVEATVEEVKKNQALEHLFRIECVKPAGVVIPTSEDNLVVIGMENAGENLADKIKAAADPAEKELLYLAAVQMLEKFHFLVTEHALLVGGQYYLTIHPLTYKDQPAVPRIDYTALVKEKILGKNGKSRLPQNVFFDLVLEDAQKLTAYLGLGCQGVAIVDADETNFAWDGIIDLNPRWGNMCWDIARLLYGGSYVLKRGLHKQGLRDYYASAMVRIAVETSMLSKEAGNRSFEEVQEELDKCFSQYQRREDFIESIRKQLYAITPSYLPDDIIEALASFTANGAAQDWDYCRKDSMDTIIYNIQAAGILVGMSEVGSLWNRLQQYQKGTTDYDVTQQELQGAVEHSYTLMKLQGFSAMARYWEEYLRESKVVPSEPIPEDSTLRSVAIPNLSEIVDGSLRRAQRIRSEVILTPDEIPSLDTVFPQFREILAFMALKLVEASSSGVLR